jgi:hypothetical protein
MTNDTDPRDFYGEAQRALQDRFDTRRIADAHQMSIVVPRIDDDRKAFIESRDFFLPVDGRRGRLADRVVQGRSDGRRAGGGRAHDRVSEL